jgi:Fe-S cluster biogenesis protein NfuA
MGFFSGFGSDSARPPAPPDPEGAGTPSSLEDTLFEAQVTAVLDQVRPSLRADGGDIELVGISGRSVKVRMMGACDGCASAGFTLRLGIEARLRKEIPGFGDLIPV